MVRHTGHKRTIILHPSQHARFSFAPHDHFVLTNFCVHHPACGADEGEIVEGGQRDGFVLVLAFVEGELAGKGVIGGRWEEVAVHRDDHVAEEGAILELGSFWGARVGRVVVVATVVGQSVGLAIAAGTSG